MSAPGLPTSVKQSQSIGPLYAVTALYGNFSMIWAASASRAKSLPAHPEITLGSCVPVQPGPCSHSDVTLTDSRPDNSIHAPPASCQSGRPSWGYWRSCQPVWDVSVKAHPLCHSVSLPRQSDIRLLSPFHPSFPSLSISCCFLPLSVSPSSACFPLETRQPLNPWSNHRFFGHTFVILRPSGFCNGVFHKHFCRWLRPDMHVVFIAAPCICASPVSAECHHQPVHSSLFFPLSFFLYFTLLLCSLTLHLATWQVTRSGPPADWLIGGLSSLSIFFQSRAKPDQAGPGHLVSWPRAQSFVASGGNAPTTHNFV